MKQWINFYNNLDRRSNHGLSKFLGFGVLPFVIGLIMFVFDRYALVSISEVAEWQVLFGGWFIPFALITNYLTVLIAGVIIFMIGLLIIALGIIIFSKVGDFFKAFIKFFSHIKEAANEEFDRSNIDLDPKKQKFNIKR